MIEGSLTELRLERLGFIVSSKIEWTSQDHYL